MAHEWSTGNCPSLQSSSTLKHAIFVIKSAIFLFTPRQLCLSLAPVAIAPNPSFPWVAISLRCPVGDIALHIGTEGLHSGFFRTQVVDNQLHMSIVHCPQFKGLCLQHVLNALRVGLASPQVQARGLKFGWIWWPRQVQEVGKVLITLLHHSRTKLLKKNKMTAKIKNSPEQKSRLDWPGWEFPVLDRDGLHIIAQEGCLQRAKFGSICTFRNEKPLFGFRMHVPNQRPSHRGFLFRPWLCRLPNHWLHSSGKARKIRPGLAATHSWFCPDSSWHIWIWSVCPSIMNMGAQTVDSATHGTVKQMEQWNNDTPPSEWMGNETVKQRQVYIHCELTMEQWRKTKQWH